MSIKNKERGPQRNLTLSVPLKMDNISVSKDNSVLHTEHIYIK